MPYVLLAGTVSGSPKSDPFFTSGKPFASVIIDADDVEYRVIGHETGMADIWCLQNGDSVSVQGQLVLSRDK
jgi:hypothetical protein